jgi:cellobiose dehydrogenase (acceptor)
VQTEVVVQHPDVVFYDFYGAWDDPIEADMSSYLSEYRTKCEMTKFD